MNRWSGTRAALRMARRDALRHRGRSILIVVMIALPVLALAGADVLARTMQLSKTEKLSRQLGQADANFTVVGGKVSQSPSVGVGWTSEGDSVSPGTSGYAAIDRKLRRALPAGTRIAEHVRSSASAGTAGRRASDIEIEGIDLRDPITRGIASVRSGRPAAAA